MKPNKRPELAGSVELTGIEALWKKRPDVKRQWQASLSTDDLTFVFRVSASDPDIRLIILFLPLTKKGKWWVLE